MENINSEIAVEKIDFLIRSLVDFSNENKYDFALYNSFANQSSRSFNRYFTEIEDQTIKEKIISDLKTDFHFQVDDSVTSMMATRKNKVENFEPGATYNIGQVIPDNRIRGFENNYNHLIELFLNRVEFNLIEQPKQHKTPTAPAPENEEFETFKPGAILKDELIKIFKNNIGFLVFTKMFELYKTETNDLANFSFLFYAMEKDFLVCSQTEFRGFLRSAKYNIDIEKIDSRQSGNNKKTKLYNSIKEMCQNSTINAQ